MKARVTVTLKSGVLDPQGKAIEGALRAMGVDGVAAVRQGKVFDIVLDDGVEDPEGTLRLACERLLANTVVENFRVELDGAEGRRADADAADTAAADAAAADASMPAEGHP